MYYLNKIKCVVPITFLVVMWPKSSTSKKIWTLFNKLYHFLRQNGLCSSLKTMVLEK